jgi:hypothetical protein
MKKTIAIFITMLLAFNMNAADLCTARNTAFKAGEVLDYELYYNLSFIWVHAGNAKFTVRPSYYGTKPAYQLRSLGATIKSFDTFFRVRDTITTYVDTVNIKPFQFRQSSREDDYWKKNEIDFLQKDNKWTAFITAKRKKGIRKDTISSEKCLFDMLSAIYQFRNIDTKNLKPNQTIPFQLVLDDGIYPLHLRYIKKEEVELKNGDTYRCLVFKPLLVKGDVFRYSDGMTIWVSDDDNKIPVYIESKIRVGSVKVQMSHISNARHPITSKITE